MSRADELWESYLDRISGREMYSREVGYRHQLDVLRGMLRHLEIVLEDEQLPAEQADRILRCVIYGGPTVADAEQRIRDHERMVEMARQGPLPQRLEGLGLPLMRSDG